MGDGAVDTNAWVPIPVPYTAVIGSVLDELDVIACVTEYLQLVYTAETCANYQGVELVDVRAIRDVSTAIERQFLDIFDGAHVDM